MADQCTQGNYAENSEVQYTNAPMPNQMYFNYCEGACTVPTQSTFEHNNRNPPACEDMDHEKLFKTVTEKMRADQLANSASYLQPKAISRYKTELCRNFHETGQCKYGSECRFAHGFTDMRIMQRHPKYKTELCRIFHSIGVCPFGVRCFFIHDISEKIAVRSMQERMIVNYERHVRLTKGPAPDAYGNSVIPSAECLPYTTISEPKMGMDNEQPMTSKIMDTKTEYSVVKQDGLQTVELEGAPQGPIFEYPQY